jgi:hypothetical protein
VRVAAVRQEGIGETQRALLRQQIAVESDSLLGPPQALERALARAEANVEASELEVKIRTAYGADPAFQGQLEAALAKNQEILDAKLSDIESSWDETLGSLAAIGEDTLGDFFEGIAQGADASFEDMARSFALRLAEMEARALATDLIGALMGRGDDATSITGRILGGAADLIRGVGGDGDANLEAAADPILKALTAGTDALALAGRSAGGEIEGGAIALEQAGVGAGDAISQAVAAFGEASLSGIGTGTAEAVTGDVAAETVTTAAGAADLATAGTTAAAALTTALTTGSAALTTAGTATATALTTAATALVSAAASITAAASALASAAAAAAAAKAGTSVLALAKGGAVTLRGVMRLARIPALASGGAVQRPGSVTRIERLARLPALAAGGRVSTSERIESLERVERLVGAVSPGTSAASHVPGQQETVVLAAGGAIERPGYVATLDRFPALAAGGGVAPFSASFSVLSAPAVRLAGGGGRDSRTIEVSRLEAIEREILGGAGPAVGAAANTPAGAVRALVGEAGTERLIRMEQIERIAAESRGDPARAVQLALTVGEKLDRPEIRSLVPGDVVIPDRKLGSFFERVMPEAALADGGFRPLQSMASIESAASESNADGGGMDLTINFEQTSGPPMGARAKRVERRGGKINLFAELFVTGLRSGDQTTKELESRYPLQPTVRDPG